MNAGVVNINAEIALNSNRHVEFWEKDCYHTALN